MPRNVRNFWIELQVDGRRSMVKTGPVAKGGEFRIDLYIRDGGAVKDAGAIHGRCYADGTLEIFHDADGVGDLTTLAKGQR